MKTAFAHLKSVSPYGQSRYIGEKKTRDETHEEFEKRTWKKRCHVDADGMVFIPPTAFKNCLQEAAKYKSIQIPGKGKSTYTKHFEAGVLVTEPLSIGVHIDDVVGTTLHVPSDGRVGGTTRVEKTFPTFQKWEGVVPFLIFDEIISEEVFEEHLRDAGQFIGVGFFRPRNRGYWGRFEVIGVEWK